MKVKENKEKKMEKRTEFMNAVNEAIALNERELEIFNKKRITKASIKACAKHEAIKESLLKMLSADMTIWVATDDASESGQFLKVEDGYFQIKFSDGIEKIHPRYLFLDERATDANLACGQKILVEGEEQYLEKVFYPSQVKVLGKEGVFSDWEVEVDEAQEVQFRSEVEDEEKVVFEGEAGEYILRVRCRRGEAYRSILAINRKGVDEEIFSSPAVERFHEARSLAALEYHKRKGFLPEGAKIMVPSWALAFAPENKEAYHPHEDDENVQDIFEDLAEGKPILQRIGVSTEGEIFSGYRRCLAALLAEREEVPVEVFAFKTRAEFVEALFDANKQREKTPEVKARERAIRHRLCSAETKAIQLAALASKQKQETPGKTAWEKVLEGEPDISPSTAAAQDKIIKWVDQTPDKKRAKQILEIFNQGGNKTSLCQDLIEFSQDKSRSKKEIDAVFGLLISKEAQSLNKAIAKAGIVPLNNKVRQTPSGATPAELKPGSKPQLAGWLIRPVMECVGILDAQIDAPDDTIVEAEQYVAGMEWEGALGKIFGFFPGDVLKAAEKIVGAWEKGKIEEGIFILKCEDELFVSRTMKMHASASCRYSIEAEMLVQGKPAGKIPVIAYYFGKNWRLFCDAHAAIGDCRIAYWALSFGNQDEVRWEVKDGVSVAIVRGKSLVVKRSVSGDYHALLGTEKISGRFGTEEVARAAALSAAFA